MKQSLKRLTALILALSMALSLLCTSAWAVEIDPVDAADASVAEAVVEEIPEESAEEVVEPETPEEPAEEVVEPEAAEEEPVEESEETEAATAEPEETETLNTAASGTCGENLTWTLDDAGTLTISGTGKMYDYDGESPWSDYRSEIMSIVIKSGVTSIGDVAFDECTSLTSVTIPDSVTSIGQAAFDECSSLTSVIIPDGVTSIGRSAFNGCSSLTSVTIPGSVTSIGGIAFRETPWLESQRDFVIVNGILVAYPGSDSIIIIPDSVTSICDWAFGSCDSVTSVTIPSSVTSIGDYAFYRCSSLTSVTISDGVTSIGDWAFGFCRRLTSVTIPDSVTSIGEDAFYSCSSLTNVTIPDSVTSIGEDLFYECSSLTSVTIPSSVTSIGGAAFYECSSLTSVTIPDSVTSIGGWAFCECSSLTSVTIPSSVTSIGDCAFDGCRNLTSVTIPSSVTSIGEYTFGYEDYYDEDIGKSYKVPIDGFTIYGYTGSAAEIYANENEITFVSLGESTTGPVILPALTDDTYTVGSEIGVSIHCSGALENFERVSVDGETVDSSNYTLEEGSTILTFKTSYLDTLSKGEHTVILYYTTGTVDTVLTVERADELVDLTACTITLSATSYTYDGTAKTPAVTVKHGDTTLTEGTDYTVSYSDNINAGTATVTVTGIGSYTDQVTEPFTITKAANSITASNVTKNASTKAQSFSLGAKAKGGTLTYKSSTSKVTVSSAGKVTIAANYAGTATITITAGDSNYATVTKSVKVTVSTIANTITASNFTKTYSTKKQTFSIGAKRKGSGKITYSSNNKSITVSSAGKVTVKAKYIGTATITIKVAAKGNYAAATKKITVTVQPTKTTLSSVKNSASKKMTVKWKKNTVGTGYQIQYSTSSTFAKGNKTATITKKATTSKTISGLTKGKTYYVRIRTYKTVSGKKVYSAWSSKKSVKITK